MQLIGTSEPCELVSMNQYSQQLGVCWNTLNKLVREGYVPTLKVGNRHMINRMSADQGFVKKHLMNPPKGLRVNWGILSLGPFVNRTEYAQQIGVCWRSVRRMIAGGEIPYFDLDGSILIDDDIARFVFYSEEDSTLFLKKCAEGKRSRH